MAERYSPTSPGPEQSFPGTDALTEDDDAGVSRRVTASRSTTPLPSSRPVCSGKVSWMTRPEREVREGCPPPGPRWRPSGCRGLSLERRPLVGLVPCPAWFAQRGRCLILAAGRSSDFPQPGIGLAGRATAGPLDPSSRPWTTAGPRPSWT